MKRREAIILTALALSLTLLPGCAAWYGYNVPDTAIGEHGVMTGGARRQTGAASLCFAQPRRQQMVPVQAGLRRGAI